MACAILIVPMSTVALEASFSVDRRVLDCYHSSLRPDTVEALVCCRDWLYGDRGVDKKNFNFHILSIINLN